ncbi:hypothetical protein PR001_g31184 [Phytophthora rubi]|uniref:Uncharacterized protein n=1 Tax=Phytophthora rubi TaxID=129364 RepID=A0A6A3GRS2_9STRA|nr:hypothetical protein PR002_g31037 [Phytophthora rubi]KAE8957995.1 hypothetical protein PR001_g31184 [Phytophthora rubi]
MYVRPRAHSKKLVYLFLLIFSKMHVNYVISIGCFNRCSVNVEHPPPLRRPHICPRMR